MKKLLSIAIACMILFSFAIAESDLSSMSYDDLVKLQKQIVAEIMSRPEWKEVEVPAGEYVIGDDIPEGFYSISAIDWSVTVELYDELDDFDDGFAIPHDGCVAKIELVEGMKVRISYKCIFAPPKALGF